MTIKNLPLSHITYLVFYLFVFIFNNINKIALNFSFLFSAKIRKKLNLFF